MARTGSAPGTATTGSPPATTATWCPATRGRTTCSAGRARTGSAGWPALIGSRGRPGTTRSSAASIGTGSAEAAARIRSSGTPGPTSSAAATGATSSWEAEGATPRRAVLASTPASGSANSAAKTRGTCRSLQAGRRAPASGDLLEVAAVLPGDRGRAVDVDPRLGQQAGQFRLGVHELVVSGHGVLGLGLAAVQLLDPHVEGLERLALRPGGHP